MSPTIAAIHRAVEHQEKCRAIHVESRVVKVQFDGEDYERSVETFTLHEHPKAKRAYAWQQWGTGARTDPKYTIILGTTGINSADDALRTAIKALYKAL